MMRKRIWLHAAALTITLAPFTSTPVEAYGRCSQWETLLQQNAPAGGWNIAKMSRTMWRESRCQPQVVNKRGGDTGLLQIHPVTWPWLSNHFGITVTRAALQQPAFNVQAAAALCQFWRNARHQSSACYRPWRGGA